MSDSVALVSSSLPNKLTKSMLSSMHRSRSFPSLTIHGDMVGPAGGGASGGASGGGGQQEGSIIGINNDDEGADGKQMLISGTLLGIHQPNYPEGQLSATSSFMIPYSPVELVPYGERYMTDRHLSSVVSRNGDEATNDSVPVRWSEVSIQPFSTTVNGEAAAALMLIEYDTTERVKTEFALAGLTEVSHN